MHVLDPSRVVVVWPNPGEFLLLLLDEERVGGAWNVTDYWDAIQSRELDFY